MAVSRVSNSLSEESANVRIDDRKKKAEEAVERVKGRR